MVRRAVGAQRFDEGDRNAVGQTHADRGYGSPMGDEPDWPDAAGLPVALPELNQKELARVAPAVRENPARRRPPCSYRMLPWVPGRARPPPWLWGRAPVRLDCYALDSRVQGLGTRMVPCHGVRGAVALAFVEV